MFEVVNHILFYNFISYELFVSRLTLYPIVTQWWLMPPISVLIKCNKEYFSQIHYTLWNLYWIWFIFILDCLKWSSNVVLSQTVVQDCTTLDTLLYGVSDGCTSLTCFPQSKLACKVSSKTSCASAGFHNNSLKLTVVSICSPTTLSLWYVFSLVTAYRKLKVLAMPNWVLRSWC